VGGGYRGDFTTLPFQPPLEVLPTSSPDTRFLGGIIKPRDFVVVSDRTTDYTETNNRWQLKRYYRAVSVGGSEEPVNTAGGAIVWIEDAWLDDRQPIDHLDAIKQNKLIAGTAMELIPGGADDPVIINWTGDPGIEAFLIPLDTAQPDGTSIRTWQIYVSGNRATGDEELAGYAVSSTGKIIGEVSLGSYQTETGATVYEFSNDTGNVFALSRNLTQQVGDTLDFSANQIVWMSAKIDAYTRGEVDQLLDDLENRVNTKIKQITDIIYNFPTDTATKIPRGNINIEAIDYAGKGIYTHDPATPVQGDIEQAPTIPPSQGG
jgi:hypothetical protein